MKAFAVVLLLVFAGLQYRLWVSDDGVRALLVLEDRVAAQQAENEALVRRNDQLTAEVRDLKEGLAAIEERARNDLGMIGADETFFHVVETPGEAAPTGQPLAPPQAAIAHPVAR